MKVCIYHATAGQGHKKVAETIGEVFKNRFPESSNIQVHDALDFTPPLFKKLYPAIYHFSVKYTPALWGLFYELFDNPVFYKIIYPLRRIHNAFFSSSLRRHVRSENPDYIVATHFLSAEVFSHEIFRQRISSKLITVITDFLPHTFWVHTGTYAYWVMGNEGKEALLARRVPAEDIHAEGIPVSPLFRRSERKKELRAQWGFADNRLTLLMTSGSFGLGPQKEVLTALNAVSENIQCFVVCGHNEKLMADLKSAQYSFPVKIFGFTDKMHDLMEASDIIIAKSGGATTSESLAKELPMILMEPIPGQETRNAHVLVSNDACFQMQQPEDVVKIINQIKNTPDLLHRKIKNIRILSKPNAADSLARFIEEDYGKRN